jgi:hypothetical protein
MNLLAGRCRRWLVGMAMGWGLYVQPAHAEPRHQRVPIHEGGISYELMVHPVYITELHFPEEITKVAVSDQNEFLVHATGRKVLLRPKPETAPGTLANLLIESRAWRVMVLLRVAAQPGDAVVSVTFELPDSTSDPRALAEQQHDEAGEDATEAALDAAEAKDATTASDAAERHDERNARPEPIEQAAVQATHNEPRVSVQVNGTIGRAVVGDRMAADRTDGLLLAGMAARVAYPVTRYHSYDAGLNVAGSGVARFSDVMLDHDRGEMLRTMMLTRFELGASARLPARLSPVVRVGLGVQGRALLASRLVLANGAAVEGPENELIIDLTGSAAVGIDYQITRAWRTGLGVTATRAVPLDNGPMFEAWEGSIHVRWN